MKGIIFFRIATKVNVLETFGDMYSDAEKEKIGKNKEVYTYTNEGIITPENWNELKDEFVKQRLSKYKDSYTLQFKIKQELKILDSSNFKSFDHNFLKDEYKGYLEKMNAEPPQKIKEFKDLFINESDYKKVVTALAESNYINPDTIVWI